MDEKVSKPLVIQRGQQQILLFGSKAIKGCTSN
jgi:hypothetical protein